MTSIKYIFLITIGFLLLSSCEKNDEISIDSENLLIGYWANAAYDNEETTFSRVAALPDNDYAIAFENTKKFTERTSGFCGTPPLSYFNVEGIWETENSLIKIENPHYFPTYLSWRIVSLTEDKLTIKRELSQQETEHRALMSLFNEFYELAYSASCVDAANWDYVGYGSKACGGFQGYIAYSKNIDVALFLEKVKAYSEEENEFNIKWGVTSTCDVIPEPKSIECKNGFPVLIY